VTAPVALSEVVAYLDSYLRVREVPDYEGAVNGLQVENSGTIDCIVAAVDASQATIDGVAALGGSPLLLVHHGLFFDGNLPVTGRRYRRLRALLTRDVAVYSSHLPLDAHPEVGNNAVLARLLGLDVQGAFGAYRGNPIGVWGLVPPAAATRSALSARLQSVLALPDAPRLIAGGPDRVQRVGIVTGGAGTMVREARDAGLDTFITGEGPHHTYFDATEFGVNVFHAGHYATETVGVRALAGHLGARFGLPHHFHDHPTGM
jgi:dinuclear metal center YbgI/SA1388 family protein